MPYYKYVLALILLPTAQAQDQGPEPRQLLWGDTHLHTSYSSDAFVNNNLSADPDTAYRYATGLPVVHPYHGARIQIVKGWLGSDGKARERVFNVAWSGARQASANAGLPSVGTSVDIASGHVDNSIGAPHFLAVWHDPGFDPGQSAFYYARVLQIPTPRHSLLDALALG